jgi:hypothetical protein
VGSRGNSWKSLQIEVDMRLPFVLFISLAVVGCGDSSEKRPEKEAIDASRDAFMNRKIHSELTPEILVTIPDDEVEQAIIDYIWEEWKKHGWRREDLSQELSPGLNAILLTWEVEAEVNNGGFNQYYFNSTGPFAEDAVKAFEFFSASQHAQLMREAIKVRAAEEAEMQKFKDENTLEAFSESYKATKLGDLDERFYDLKENLSELRIAKIRARPDLFMGQ